jgi:predicted dehydrogenase
VGGRGRQLIEAFAAVPGVKIAALCDVDQDILQHSVQQFRARQQQVAAFGDLRRVIDDKTIDAVAIATPNHWHALALIWAAAAGKDVYVEKPFSYNIWEGRQMVAAARKYQRIVQVGTQRRSSQAIRQALDALRRGELGPIRCARAILARPRESIGKVAEPRQLPASVDYDLWCGPAPRGPLLRKQLHYDWHWFWPAGNGEMGNNGSHFVDICRWALGQEQPPPRVVSLGGRFAWQDDGQTPNTQIAVFDYRPAPLICEIRNLRATPDVEIGGKPRRGIVIECEGGCFMGDIADGAFFDRKGKKIKDFRGQKLHELEATHMTNFVDAMRSRKAGSLYAEALVGHVSATCCHMANISYRLGKRAAPEALQEAIQPHAELAEVFQRCRDHLRVNGLDLTKEQAVLGPWLTWDARGEHFVGSNAVEANALCRREYRKPFVVPEIT